MAGGAIITVLLGAAAAMLLPDAEVRVADGVVRLGDIAALDGVAAPVRRQLERRIIAGFPPGRTRIVLSRRALAALVRRSVPGLAVSGAAPGEEIVLRSEAVAPREAGGCLATTRPIAAGEWLRPTDAAAVSCRTGAPRSPVAFDPQVAATRATADLEAGSYLGRIRLIEPNAVARGDSLTLTSTAGPVRIERQVHALQPGRPGGRLFVRTEEGDVIAADLAAAEAETEQ